jgi:hypothetical protein
LGEGEGNVVHGRGGGVTLGEGLDGDCVHGCGIGAWWGDAKFSRRLSEGAARGNGLPRHNLELMSRRT